MFSFFSKKATIHSIGVPDLGWLLERDEPHMRFWRHPDVPIAISLNFFDQAPDIPSLADIDLLRQFYRKLAVAARGGLIEVTVVDLQGYAAAKTIFKIPQDPKGMTYVASLTVPFRDCSYVVKVQAMEVGATGMRDALVLDQLMETGVVKLRDDGLHGWSADPYAPDFQGGTLMNLAEQAVYDAHYPDHPLSQVRAWLSTLQSALAMQDELGKLKPFAR